MSRALGQVMLEELEKNDSMTTWLGFYLESFLIQRLVEDKLRNEGMSEKAIRIARRRIAKKAGDLLARLDKREQRAGVHR